MVFEPAEQKRRAQHEQRVGEDRTGDGGFHKDILPGPQRRQRDEQLGEVAQGRIEQAADQVACLGGDRLRGAAEESRQRHDSGNRQQEKKRVRLWFETLHQENNGDQHQEPQQRGVADLFRQRSHALASLDHRSSHSRFGPAEA